MDNFFDSMLQEIDRYTGTVNLEGENITLCGDKCTKIC